MKKKSTVLDGFFPYLAQMITSMRGCVAYNDLWPWPISSRSFGLGLENRVRSVTLSVLDRLFPYLPQIFTTIRECRVGWPLTLTYIFHVIRPWLWKRVRSVTFSVLDRLFFSLGIQYDSIVWVIMRRGGGGGYPQNAGVLVVLVSVSFTVILISFLYDRNTCPNTIELWVWNLKKSVWCHKIVYVKSSAPKYRIISLG